MLKAIAAGALALGVVAGLSFAGVAPAAASVSIRTGADDPGPIPSGWSSIGGKPYKLTPSSSKLRSYMINTLGKVLGKATPKAWQAEQLANQYRYNADWESVDAAVNGVPRWDPTSPSSYDDYVLAHAEAQFPGAAKGGTSGRAYAPPATKAGGFSKVIGAAGGAATALTGFSFGTAIGRGIDQLLGIDVDGTVCSSSAAGLLSMVTGADCSPVSNTIPADLQNSGVIAGSQLGGTVCGNTGGCISSLSVQAVLAPSWSNGGVIRICAQGTGSGGAGWDAHVSVWAHGASAGSTSYSWPVLGTPTKGAGGSVPCSTPFEDDSAYFGPSGSTVAWSSLAAAQAGAQTIVVDCAAPAGSNCSSPSAVGMVEMPSDPVRHFRCVVTATDGSTYQADSDGFTETDSALPVPSCPALPDTKVPQAIDVHEVGGGQDTVVGHQDATDDYKAQRTNFPGCDEGACGLDLQIADDAGTFTSCFLLDSDPNPCVDWFKDPDRATKYQCTFGGQVVDISECFLYSGVFDPTRRAAGAAYSDPNTGTWSGGQSTPTEGQAAMGNTVTSPAGPRTCDVPQSSGFDPIGFVMRPVECALEWAFVPDPVRVQVSLGGADQAWQQTTPAMVAASVASWKVTPSVTGCRTDIGFPVPMIGKTVQMPVIDTCPGSWVGSIAPWCAGVVTVTLGIAAAFACKRIIGKWVDYS